MKNRTLLALVLVLSLVPMAHATVIDVITDGIGDKGHKGTIDDPLEVWEIIHIIIVLNHNPYPDGFSSYDGYLLSEMDVSLHVSGPGKLSPHTDKNDNVDLGWNPGFSSAALSPTIGSQVWQQNGFDYLRGQSTDGIPYATLIEYMHIYPDGPGNIQLDLSLHGTTKYSPYKTAIPQPPPYNPYPGGWTDATESDLGDLIIYVVPEPATVLLLGLGSLALLRKRRA